MSPGHGLDAARAWELLCGVRTEADAEAAGLVRTAGAPGPEGDRWRWREALRASPGAVELADRYLTLCLAGPRVTFAQLGQSLDGFIATRTGDADYVTGEEDRLHLHRLRALADAVLVGAGTAVSDDPQLTVRACAGTHPVRVVLDPRGRVPRGSKVFTDGSAPTLWVVGAGQENGSARAGGPGGGHGVEVLTLPDSEAFAPRNLVRVLAGRGLGRLLVEGGGVTVSRFLHDRALHRLYVTVAPVLLGDGVPGLRFDGPEVMREALRPQVRRAFLGEDTLFELGLSPVGPGPVGPAVADPVTVGVPALSGGPVPAAGAPLGDEHPGPGQARREGEDPVHDGDGQSL